MHAYAVSGTMSINVCSMYSHLVRDTSAAVAGSFTIRHLRNMIRSVVKMNTNVHQRKRNDKLNAACLRQIATTEPRFLRHLHDDTLCFEIGLQAPFSTCNR